MGWTSFFLSALKSGRSSTLKRGCGWLFRLRIFETVFTLKPLSFSACSTSAVLTSGSIPFRTTC